VKSRWATSKHEETDLCKECEEKAKADVTPPIYSLRKETVSGQGPPPSRRAEPSRRDMGPCDQSHPRSTRARHVGSVRDKVRHQCPLQN
jgi:hypothetical protein